MKKNIYNDDSMISSNALSALKKDLNTYNDVNAKFAFDDKAYKSLNFDIIFPQQNLIDTQVGLQNIFLDNPSISLNATNMQQLFNENLNIIQFFKNDKQNINMCINIDNFKTLTLKNKNEFTNDPNYFSQDNNIVAIILIKLLKGLKREFNSNIIDFNSVELIGEGDNNINDLSEQEKYEIVFNKYSTLLNNIVSLSIVNCYTLVNVLCSLLYSNIEITTFFNNSYEPFIKNQFMLTNSCLKSDGYSKTLNEYSTYLQIVFNDNDVNIMDLIKHVHIFINVVNRNIIITKMNCLCLKHENFILALLLNKEEFNFSANKLTVSTQFRWTLNKESIDTMSSIDSLVSDMPYINKMIFMTTNDETSRIFEKYKITPPSWLLTGGNRVLKKINNKPINNKPINNKPINNKPINNKPIKTKKNKK